MIFFPRLSSPFLHREYYFGVNACSVTSVTILDGSDIIKKQRKENWNYQMLWSHIIARSISAEA